MMAMDANRALAQQLRGATHKVHPGGLSDDHQGFLLRRFRHHRSQRAKPIGARVE
jgi:hypothetical protein